MKEVQQDEFESFIRQIIEGKKSETSVIRELKTESRTFYNKLQELSMSNPELYTQYVKVHPYKPKERKDINIRGFVIETLKSGKTVEEMCEEYGIGRRTISRKILALKESDNNQDKDLYELYKRIAYKKSRAQELSDEDIEEINELESEEIIGINDVERRRQALLKLEKEYQDLCMQVGKEEAAKKLGYTQNRIYKLLNELYRIEIERHAKQIEDNQGKETKGKKYRESMKVNVTRTVVQNGTKVENHDNIVEQTSEREGR